MFGLHKLIVGLVSGLAISAFASAQSLAPDEVSTTSDEMAKRTSAMVKQVSEQAAIRSAEANRGSLKAKILNDWRSTAETLKFDIAAWEAKLGGWIDKADAKRLVWADSAIHYDHLVMVLKGWDAAAIRLEGEATEIRESRKARPTLDGQKLLGDVTQDLTFVPLAVPCRLYASSGTGTNAGFFGSPNTYFRNFSVDGSVAYAGGLAGCGTNGIEPAAVVLNLTSFSNNGGGNYKVVATGAGIPNVSNLNMNSTPVGATDATANLVISSVCQGCSSDIFVQGSFASGVVSHLIIDVLGYFVPPQATPLQCTEAYATAVTVSPGSDACSNPPACATGFTRVSTLFDNSGFAGLVSSQLNGPAGGGTQVCGRNTGSSTTTSFRAGSVCCRVPGR